MCKYPVGQPEKIVAAAYRFSGGEITIGMMHVFAGEDAERQGILKKYGITLDDLLMGTVDGQMACQIKDGFVTSTGRFVDREEAALIMDPQRKRELFMTRGLDSFDFSMPGRTPQDIGRGIRRTTQAWTGEAIINAQKSPCSFSIFGGGPPPMTPSEVRAYQARMLTRPEEKVIASAYQFPDGEVSVGSLHIFALEDAERKGLLKKYGLDLDTMAMATVNDELGNNIKDGFVTNRGRFVDRNEAYLLFYPQSKKDLGHNQWLDSADVAPDDEYYRGMAKMGDIRSKMGEVAK